MSYGSKRASDRSINTLHLKFHKSDTTDSIMEEQEVKETMLMGRDISHMPCFRQTFLYSISSGLAVGFLNFMLTSRVQRSAHLAFGTYGCVTLAYWLMPFPTL
nr:cytochrome c oxidase assembly protein COX20, mitochondrial-like isoform X2 [Procambarus clarkii]